MDPSPDSVRERAMLGPEAFYDDLADEYHLVHADWQRSVLEINTALDRVIRLEFGDRPARVLDVTCGIGTQAIALALRGHEVHGSDLSARAIERARREAARFGVDVTFHVADVRRVAEIAPGTFDVVLSAGNSLPHLMTDADLLLALDNMRRKLAPGGLAMISIRDYDAHIAARTRVVPPQVTGAPGSRAIVFQVWEWDADGGAITPTLFVLRESEVGWSMTARTTRYRALRRADLSRLLAEAGFSRIQWEGPERAGPDFAPLVTARNPPS
jgi:SAM-dependent methyltransferase